MSVPNESAPAVIAATSNDVPQDHERIAAAALAWGDETVADPVPVVIGGASDEEIAEGDPAAPVVAKDDEKPAQRSSEKYKAVVAQARKVRQEKAARHQAVAQSRAREQALEQKEAQLQEHLSLLKTDPVAYFESTGQNPAEVYARMTQQAIKPGEVKTETQFRQMAALLERERTERQAELREMREAQARAEWETKNRAAKAQFSTLSGDAEQYPHLAALSEEDRLQYADDVADELNRNKVPYTLAYIAEVLEDHFADLSEKLTKSTKKGGDSTPANQSGTTAKGKKPSRTITSDLSGQTASSPKSDISEEARIKAAMEAATAWANSSS